LSQSAAKAAYRHCRVTPNQSMCFAIWQSERCGAGCVTRLAGASWLGVQGARAFAVPRATAHASLKHNCLFCKMAVSQSQAPFVTATKPFGFTKKHLCLVPSLAAGASAACTPQPLRVLRAVACRPCGLLASGYWSGAARMVLVSGFAVHHVCAPPTHGPRLLRGFGARLPVRPQGAPCSAALGSRRLRRRVA